MGASHRLLLHVSTRVRVKVEVDLKARLGCKTEEMEAIKEERA